MEESLSLKLRIAEMEWRRHFSECPDSSICGLTLFASRDR
jgi:hypothetical protein